MQTKMSIKHKLMAYTLNVEFNYTMTAIARLMNVSQSTISLAIKEVKTWLIIYNLSKELAETRQHLLDCGFRPQIETAFREIE